MKEEFNKLVAANEFLHYDIENIREDTQGNILFDYQGFLTCAVFTDGVRFGEIADIHPSQVETAKNTPMVRWFATLENLLRTLNDELNPENF